MSYGALLQIPSITILIPFVVGAYYHIKVVSYYFGRAEGRSFSLDSEKRHVLFERLEGTDEQFRQDHRRRNIWLKITLWIWGSLFVFGLVFVVVGSAYT